MIAQDCEVVNLKSSFLLLLPYFVGGTSWFTRPQPRSSFRFFLKTAFLPLFCDSWKLAVSRLIRPEMGQIPRFTAPILYSFISMAEVTYCCEVLQLPASRFIGGEWPSLLRDLIPGLSRHITGRFSGGSFLSYSQGLSGLRHIGGSGRRFFPYVFLLLLREKVS